tara:strand:+ start:316 stop:702 length:387 start_codon:yes stop_codon:yes gene_type:complete
MAVTSVSGNFEITGLDATVVVRDATIDIARDVLETTNLGESSRTYVTGLRGATGSATMLYENSLLNDVYAKINTDNQGSITATLTLNSGKTIAGSILITSVGSTVTVGDITSTNVAFQFSGDLTISST